MDFNKQFAEGKCYAPYKKFIGSVVPNWLMRRTDISQGAKLCFGRLSQFAGKDKCAFPGHEALAKELGVSVPAVKGYLRELGPYLGVIESQRMGSGHFSLYFFIDRKGIVEFRSDGQKTIRQADRRTDGQNSNRHGPTDGQDDIRPDGQESISPNNEENQYRRESSKRITKRFKTGSVKKNQEGEIEW